MKKKVFRYKNLFIYVSLQSVGHVEDYFAHNTEKLAALIFMPRLKNKFNLFRLYKRGKLVKQEKVRSSSNIILYYFLWYVSQIYFLFKTFSFREKFILLGGHPICFFGMSLIKIVRNCEFAYWIGDYFPGEGFVINAFERLKKFYHNRVAYAFYLSDDINEIMNGKILNIPTKKTVMWGVKNKHLRRNLANKKITLLFVGLIKDSQGLEFFYEYLKMNKNYSVKILGVCDPKLYKSHLEVIKKYKIQNQVYFPNRFFSEKELVRISKECHVGIALYTVDKSNPTYYTDPGKIKTYIELGLPVIMSNTSAIAPYIKNFKAGEVINRSEYSLENALCKVKKNYREYSKGVEKFSNYFYYESYYKEKFSCFEINI